MNEITPYPESSNSTIDRDSIRFFVKDARGRLGYPHFAGVYPRTRQPAYGPEEIEGMPYIFATGMVIDNSGGNGPNKGGLIFESGTRVKIGAYTAIVTAPKAGHDNAVLSDIQPA